MKRTTVYLIIGICLASIFGCQSAPWQKNSMPPVELLDEDKPADAAPAAEAPKAEATDRLQMATSQRIKDVPLPEKAKEDLDRSYIYESANLQLGRMVYTIRTSVNELAQFYIDNMPASGWNLINVKQAEGGAELLFRKAGKKLEVSVIPLGLMRGQRLVLHLVPDSVTEAQI
jgi:hypothetical protein